MFTGIVLAKGRVAAVEPRGDDVRLHIDTAALPMNGANLGDSISVSGVCLTVTEKSGGGFWADVSIESLNRSTLGGLKPGDTVNLEPALTPNTAMGGHLVNGHVDATGTIVERVEEGRSVRFRFKLPANLSRYVVEKGSICIDGISLTVNTTLEDTFDVNIIPHTLDVTTLGDMSAGAAVNLEVDIVARYVEKLLAAKDASR